MRCEEARELLPAHVDGEAVPGLAEHLATCRHCRAELDAYRAMATRLADLRDRAETPAHLVERIVALIPAPSLLGRLSISVHDHPLAFGLASLAGALGAAVAVAALRRGRRAQAAAA